MGHDVGGTVVDRRQKVQSVEVGMGLLIALSRLGPSASLTTLARAAQMPPSKAHRYLRALVNSRLVDQEEATGLYRLGPEARAIGFAAIGHMDVVAASGGPLAALRDRVDETCMLAVWANHGTTVVRIEPAKRAVVVNVRIGSVLPLLVSAAGLVFAGLLDNQQVRDAQKTERRQLLRQGRQDLVQQSGETIALVRASHLATVRNTLTPGVSAVAAPVFDYQSQVAGVIAVMGSSAYFDESPSGPIAAELRVVADLTSRILGQPQPPVSPAPPARPVRRGAAPRPVESS